MNSLSRRDVEVLMGGRGSQALSDESLDKMNKLLEDPLYGEAYRESILSYKSTLLDGKFKFEQYINAVVYVTGKLRGLSNKDSYFIAFPDRLIEWDTKGYLEKDIASAISTYHKSKLVTKILEQSIIPTWIINQDLYQEALNKQADLMRDSRSDMVKHLASKTILEMLKRPEAAELKLDIGVKENGIMQGIKNSIDELVKTQREKIIDGSIDARVAAEQLIIVDGDYE